MVVKILTSISIMEFNKRIRQFPEQADIAQPTWKGLLNDPLDEWCAELDWLIETYQI